MEMKFLCHLVLDVMKTVNLSVDNLDNSSYYNITLKSSNSIGEQSTTAASFCKHTHYYTQFLDNYFYLRSKLLCHWVRDCIVLQCLYL